MENWIGGIFLLVVVLAFLFAWLYLVGSGLFGIVGVVGHTWMPMGRHDRALLEGHSAYYRTLSREHQREFRKRVQEFVYEKEWTGRDIALTREMQLRISAIAVQVSFGLERMLFLHFANIIVYPDVYRDRRSGALFKGATYVQRGAIALSWEHFVEGDADLTDALHLGLHEMAHALWLENVVPNEEDDFLDPAVLADWKRLALLEIEMIRAGESRLFRRYAGTNEAEFFACAVEYFFERPADFNERMPAEYNVLCRLLKQDPAGTARSTRQPGPSKTPKAPLP